QGQMSRMYIAETMLSITGTVADERLPLRPSQLLKVATSLLGRLNGQTGPIEGLDDRAVAWIDHAARDLKQAGRNAVVTAGASAPASVHAWVHAINDLLGNAGNTVTYLPAPVQRPPAVQALRELVQQ